MSIPKEPRQLMINIMYLVLTAMLALNVSAKIFNAFDVVDRGLKKSNTALDDANSKLPQAIADRAKKKPELQTYADRVGPIQETSAEFVSYIEGIKDNLIDLAGNQNGTVDEGDFIEKDGHRVLRGKKNKDVTTREIVNSGLGDEIEQKIKEYRERFVSFYDSTDVQQRAGDISLVLDENWKTDKVGGHKSWAEYNFKQMPLAATMPIFSKYINDAKSSEAALLNYLSGKVGGEEVVLDKYKVVSAPKKSYIIRGEPFETELFMSATASEKSATSISIAVNGQARAMRDGVVKYTETPTTLGVKKYRASATITNPVTGEKTTVNNEFEYEVGERSATVSADMMNVFYIGVDNPITVSAAGISSNDLKVSGSGVTLSPNGKSKYIVKASSPGEAKITLTAPGLKASSYPFRVKRIPDPVAQLGANEGGSIGNGTFKAQLGVIANLKNFDFKARCNIAGFQIVRVAPRQDAQRATNAGGTLSGKAKNLANLAKPGDTFYFEDVKAKCPGDKAVRRINDMVFRIN